MRTAVFAFSRQGCKTARKIQKVFNMQNDICSLYTVEKYADSNFLTICPPLVDFTKHVFNSVDAMVFVSSTGIAVRAVAPHISDKQTDPAVIVVDELGNFAVSLLSGHIGGANELTAKIAAELKATPVITTATDINGRFAVDSWAKKQRLIIDDIKMAKRVSAAILEKDVCLTSDFSVSGRLPDGIVSGDDGGVGICISCFNKHPFDSTLLLVPQILTVGIGCRRNTEKQTIADVINEVFEEYKINPKAVSGIASIDLKADEKGLLQFAKEMKWNIDFYSSEELKAVQGDFTQSDFVQSVTGVDNVCERAALKNADRLIIKKTAKNGVTVAVAAKNWEVSFG